MSGRLEITIQIDCDTDDRLNVLAKSLGRDKASIARDALVGWIEDQQDIRDAESVLAEGNPTISLADVKRTLGLEG